MSAASRTALAALTGGEDPIDPRHPLGALSEFYRAFNRRDLDLMERNWVTTDEASIAAPLGGIRRGWPEVRELYRRIFQDPAAVCVELADYSIQGCGEMFYAVGRERGVLQSEYGSLDLSIRTIRLFRLIGNRWRQVHHHGSIENPERLLRYQAAIR
jgi:hypothetical protein